MLPILIAQQRCLQADDSYV